MLRQFYRIKPGVWGVLLMVLAVVLVPFALQHYAHVDTTFSMMILQPSLAILAAWLTRLVTHGRRDHPAHQSEKSWIIGSVLAVWFVGYFASGMLVTYVHNVVAMDWLTILLNCVSFGTTAVMMEYMRHSVMVYGGRRVMWAVGIVVALIFAIEQITIAPLLEMHTVLDGSKIIVANIMPAIVMSALLTYLAVTTGLWPQLTFRLGVLAVMYVPPIIPKYDWYLTGVVWLILALAVYITIDQTRRSVASHHRRHYRHIAWATNVMFFTLIIGLALFMIGGFTYRPQAIMSNSMHPVFDRGAMVVVQKADPMAVVVGDIIQYQMPDRSMTHRVIAIDYAADGSGKRMFITKGDNNPSADQPVQANQVVGIVRAQIPYIGYPSVLLREMVK